MGIDIADKVLKALESGSGTMSVTELRAMYDTKGDGQRIAFRLIAPGYAEWVRNYPCGPAKAIRLARAGASITTAARTDE